MAKRFNLNNNLIWPLVILTIAFGAFFLKPWQTKPQETISVSAEGKTQTTPNIAKINATVRTQNPNLENARKENDQKVSQLVAEIKALGIEEKDIKTQSISAGQSYEIQTFPPQKTTNQVSTSFEITVRNFNIADQVIATLTQNGATDLYGPNLTSADEDLEMAKSRARENAVNIAQAKAEELAKLSKRKLGKVVKIQEQGDFGIPGPIPAIGGADLMQKERTIQPGQNEVTINVSVDFSLR